MVWDSGFRALRLTANLRKLEHGFRMISARIPHTLPFSKGRRVRMFQLPGFYFRVKR